MTRSTIVSLTLIALAVSPVVAKDQERRRAPAGGPESAGPAPTQVPRYPYAGKWEGTFSMTDATGGPATSPLAMTFVVKDGARQSYDGETRLGAGAALAHTNVSAAATSSGSTQEAAAMRRSRSAPPASSGPSAASVEMDTLAAGTHAQLVHHTPTRSTLLCDQGGRCVTLATLTWEEQDRRGRKYEYSAKLVGADSIAGSVTITDQAGRKSSGTFELKRSTN